MTSAEKYLDYIKQLRTPFVKRCRLRFLNPDGTTAFALDNNPNNEKNTAFIAEGSITVNLQNGQRRTASVTLSNLDGRFDYNLNSIWFGQEIAIDEGLVLSNGEDYYIQQGVFLIEQPTETFMPNSRVVTFNLVDKWANLDGTLFGNLEATHIVETGTSIYEPIASILNLDRGNGYPVDRNTPIFTEYYNNKTQELPDGTTVGLAISPYTLTVDGQGGTYGQIILGMAEMVNAWVGYDSTGSLRIDPSQDDILDINKPIQWQFDTDEIEFLGATYQVQNNSVYNDFIVLGEQLSDYQQPYGRAQNLDPRSPTNINIIGKRTMILQASGYATKTQCQDRAEWELKRASVLQKAVSISCGQMFHIKENELVTIVRSDKQGAPVERHLVMGFSRPLTSGGAMTINAVSVVDFPVATEVTWGGQDDNENEEP